jgi:hypothetical protein
MKAVDILVELDYQSMKSIIKWYERVRHCNPRFIEEFYPSENKSDNINQWDKDGKMRNIIEGEIVRRGDRMQKPCKIAFQLLNDMLDNLSYWMNYRVERTQYNVMQLIKENGEHSDIVKMTMGQGKLYLELMEEVAEYKALIKWMIQPSGLSQKPQVNHIFWLREDFGELEYANNHE